MKNMKGITGKKSIGFYFVLVTILAGLVSSVRYFVWAGNNDMLDMVTAAALLAGILLDVVLLVKECDYFIILSTAAYSIAVARLLTQSVGSFVDAFQGINMFGNAAQVGDIINISILMAVTIVLSIVASFMNRVKM